MEKKLFPPVLPHDLWRPRRFADFAARLEPAHYRLDVEYGRTVDGVETLDVQAGALDLEQAAYGGADAVRPGAVALRENSYLRLRGIAGRMPRLFFQVRFGDAIEMKDYFDVRELIEAEERIRRESRRVESDHGDDVVSFVVEPFCASISNVRDRYAP